MKSGVMKQTRSRVIDMLLHSDEPSLRWKVLVRVLEGKTLTRPK
jgi:hypothetical protein